MRSGPQSGLYGILLARMGWCEWSFGDFERAVNTTRSAAALCQRFGDAEGAGQAYVHMQWSQMCTGDFAASLATRGDVLRMLEQQFNVRWHLFAYAAASLTNTWLGRWEEAMDAGLTALRQGEAQADDSVIAFAAWTLSTCLAARRDHAEAVKYGELALQKAPTPGDRAWSMATLACASMQTGDLAQSIEILEQTVRVLRDARFIWSEVFAMRLGEAYVLAGQYARAEQTLLAVVEVAERCRMRLVLGVAHRLLADVALGGSASSVTRAEAASHVERSIAILKEIGAQNELAMAYVSWGRLLALDARRDEARAALTDALETFERLGTFEEPARVREMLAAL
jgi:tetratricopeptide (TPR) repeat protein